MISTYYGLQMSSVSSSLTSVHISSSLSQMHLYNWGTLERLPAFTVIFFSILVLSFSRSEVVVCIGVERLRRARRSRTDQLYELFTRRKGLGIMCGNAYFRCKTNFSNVLAYETHSSQFFFSFRCSCSL